MADPTQTTRIGPLEREMLHRVNSSWGLEDRLIALSRQRDAIARCGNKGLAILEGGKWFVTPEGMEILA